MSGPTDEMIEAAAKAQYFEDHDGVGYVGTGWEFDPDFNMWREDAHKALTAALAVDPYRQPGYLVWKDDEGLRDALVAWFEFEVTYERFIDWSDGEFGEHLLSLLRSRSINTEETR